METEDIGIAIGVANYNKNQRRTFKLEKQKANEYRPLPPLGRAAEKGIWMVGLGVHWGDKGTNGRMNPYECIQRIEKMKDGSKRVVKRCPRCEKNTKVLEKREAKAAEFKTKGLNDIQIGEKLKQVDQYLRDFNRSFRFYMNALNASLEIGRLDVSATHADQLREAISKLLKKGVDVTSVAQGVFMNFYYEGLKGHTVQPVLENGLNPGEMKLRLAPLTLNILRSLKNESWDLLDLFPKLTEDEIQRLVDNEGKADVVDAVFASKRTEKLEAKQATAQSGGSSETTSSAPVAPSINVPDVDLDDIVGKGTTAALASRPASTQVTQAAPVPPPAQTIADMPDDDFMKGFGINAASVP
jgi:hypothetical protein